MKFFRLIPLPFFIISLCISIFLAIPTLLKTSSISSKKYDTIITIWHTDTFQGGEGSRKKFLINTSKLIEKKNSGVLFFVLEKSPNEINELLKKGEYPDIISYGNGINVEKSIKIEKPIEFKGCNILNQTKALPWCMGRYFLLENTSNSNKLNKEELLVSRNKYNQPYIALLLNDKHFNSVKVLDCDKAFSQFANNKYKYYLGTQRDVVKGENLNLNYNAYPLDNFNDLIQYVSITTSKSEKLIYINQFINELISKNNQEKLKDYSLYSPYYEFELKYEKLNVKRSNNNYKVLRFLISENESNELYNLSEEVYKTTKDKNKIENIEFLYWKKLKFIVI